MDVDFIFIGYCKKENHDKIWGILSLEKLSDGRLSYNKPVYIFWGGRGKSLGFKDARMSYDLTKKSIAKENKGYKQINKDKLYQIWPNFNDTLNQRFMLHVLTR